MPTGICFVCNGDPTECIVFPNVTNHRHKAECWSENLGLDFALILKKLDQGEKIYICLSHFDEEDFEIFLTRKYLKSNILPRPLPTLPPLSPESLKSPLIIAERLSIFECVLCSKTVASVQFGYDHYLFAHEQIIKNKTGSRCIFESNFWKYFRSYFQTLTMIKCLEPQCSFTVSKDFSLRDHLRTKHGKRTKVQFASFSSGKALFDFFEQLSQQENTVFVVDSRKNLGSNRVLINYLCEKSRGNVSDASCCTAFFIVEHLLNCGEYNCKFSVQHYGHSV